MVLGKLPVPGRPIYLDYSRARAYCACSRCGWGVVWTFFLYPFSSLSPSLWETARYRLKYCLKGPLNPKQQQQQQQPIECPTAEDLAAPSKTTSFPRKHWKRSTASKLNIWIQFRRLIISISIWFKVLYKNSAEGYVAPGKDHVSLTCDCNSYM